MAIIVDYGDISNVIENQDTWAFYAIAEWELFKMHLANNVKYYDNNELGMFVHNTLKYYNESKVLEYRDKDTIRGIIGYKYMDNRCYISTVYVDEAYRKSGIATSLIAGITAFSSQEVFVVVGEFNTPAIELYKKMGFTKVENSKFIKDNNLEGMVEYKFKRGGYIDND